MITRPIRQATLAHGSHAVSLEPVRRKDASCQQSQETGKRQYVRDASGAGDAVCAHRVGTTLRITFSDERILSPELFGELTVARSGEAACLRVDWHALVN